MSTPPNKQSGVPQALSISTPVVPGPLPSPDILARYNQLIPGAAGRIIAMAETDAMHLQSMEEMRLSASFQERRLGQIFGFSIAVMGLSASVFLAVTGHEITASVLGGATLISLVSVFVIGRLVGQTKPN